MGFLVLSRKLDERIIISGNIKIVIVEINCRKNPPVVRLGIEAPKEISVHRQEIYDAIQRDKIIEAEIKSRNTEIEVTDEEKCPFCGETEIYFDFSKQSYIFLCGYSGTDTEVITKCLNTKKS